VGECHYFNNLDLHLLLAGNFPITAVSHLPQFDIISCDQVPKLKIQPQTEKLTAIEDKRDPEDIAEYMDRSMAKVADLTPPSTRQPSPSPSPMRIMEGHTQFTFNSWLTLNTLRHGKPVSLDGESLGIAGIVAVAKYESPPRYLVVKKSSKTMLGIIQQRSSTEVGPSLVGSRKV
jgi:hypothetical protein